MRLKARVAPRSSREPPSGRGGARTSTPSRSAASAKRASGRVTRCPAQTANRRMKPPASAIQNAMWMPQRSEVVSDATVKTSQLPSRCPTEMAIFRRLGSRSGTGWPATVLD